MSKLRWYKQLEDIQVGAKIVITPGGFGNKLLEKVTVERVTKTQFTAGGIRYMKSTGEAVGDKHSYYSPSVSCHYGYKKNSRVDLLTWEDADKDNANTELTAKKADMVQELKNLANELQPRWASGYDQEKLNQIVELLKNVREDDNV